MLTQKTGVMSRVARWIPFVIWAVALLVIAPRVLSTFDLSLLGRFLTYAIVAIGLDLIWGYTGMLSLGQGLFFGLGAYCFAMYLKLEQSGTQLPDFMSLYGVTQLPALWQPFYSPVFALIAAIAVPAIVAAVMGYIIFRSRVQGVYFSIITQALTAIVSLLLIGQQQLINGTNGISSLETIFGYKLSAANTKLGLYLVTVVVLGATFLLARWLTDSRFGRLLVALRDDENRMRFTGYNPVMIKVIVFALSAALAGLAGALFIPQVGIISPAAMGIVPSIEIVIWVAVGGRGTLVGPIIGAILVNEAKSKISSASPDTWQLIIGVLFIVAVLLFPMGLLGFLKTQIAALRTRLSKTALLESAVSGEREPSHELDVPGFVETGR